MQDLNYIAPDWYVYSIYSKRYSANDHYFCQWFIINWMVSIAVTYLSKNIPPYSQAYKLGSSDSLINYVVLVPV